MSTCKALGEEGRTDSGGGASPRGMVTAERAGPQPAGKECWPRLATGEVSVGCSGTGRRQGPGCSRPYPGACSGPRGSCRARSSRARRGLRILRGRKVRRGFPFCHHKDRTQAVISSCTHLFHVINTHDIQNNVIKCRKVSASDS